MPAWPEALPNEFLRDNYREGIKDNVLRSPTDSGPEQRRPLTTKTLRHFRGVIRMTAEEKDQLVAFYETDLGNGSLKFDFPDPTDPDSSISLAFIESPTWVPFGVQFDVALAVDEQP